MTNHLELRLTLSNAKKFEHEVPAAFDQIIVRAEQGYECLVPKNSEAYLYFTVLELENGQIVERTRYKRVVAPETENLIIDDINGYQILYFEEVLIGVSEIAILYNSFTRRKQT